MTFTEKLVQAGPAQGKGAKARSKAIIQTEVAHSALAPKLPVRKPHATKRRTPVSVQAGAHPSSKVAKVLRLLKRPGGVTLNAIMKATEWQAHSVRGFLSATISKRKGLKLTSIRSDAGERVYSVGGGGKGAQGQQRQKKTGRQISRRNVKTEVCR